MIVFNKLTLKDLPLVGSYMNANPSRICDRTTGCLFLWREYFDNSFAIVNDCLVLCATFPNGDVCYSYPVGRNCDDALTTLDNYCANHNQKLKFCSITDEQLSLLKKRYPLLEAVTNTGLDDYLYESDKIVNLSGKKYATQRNHINKFTSLYPNFTFEKIEKQSIPAIVEFLDSFEFHSHKSGYEALIEKMMSIEFMRDFDKYDQIGGCLKVDGKIIGFSVGEIVSDTLFVHIEKADISYEGAYQVVTNQFLKMFLTPEVKYVNREEDMGDEGLRQSKQSYHPVEMLTKYLVTINKG